MKTQSIKKLLQIFAIGSAVVSLCSCNTDAEEEIESAESAHKSEGISKLNLQALRGVLNKVVHGDQSDRGQEQPQELSREEIIRKIRESEVFKNVDPERLSELEAQFRDLVSRGTERLEESEQNARFDETANVDYEDQVPQNQAPQGYYR